MRNIFKSITVSMKTKEIWATYYIPPYIDVVTWRGRGYTFTGNNLLNRRKAFKSRIELLYDKERSKYV